MSSSRFAIATHVLVALEFVRRQGGGSLSSQALARSIGTHPVFVRELIQSLRSAKLVTATEGRGGGVKIAAKAEDITLRKVYQAVEDRSALKENPRRIYKDCPVSCAMKKLMQPIVKEVDGAMMKVLEKRRISDLADSIN